MRSFIAGIDAGATSAYAIMTLDGEVIEVKSRKDAKGDFLFESLAKYSPIFIACDTNPPSQAARKLKRSFSARLYYPAKSLSIIEKDMICKDKNVKKDTKKKPSKTLKEKQTAKRQKKTGKTGEV